MRTILGPGTMGPKWPPGLEVKVMSSPYVPRKPPSKWAMWKWMYWDSESEKPQPEERIYVMEDGSVVMSPLSYSRLLLEIKPRKSVLAKL